MGTILGTRLLDPRIPGSRPIRKLLIGKEKMARSERFELPTFWFVARRSIQLSYERALVRDSHANFGLFGCQTMRGSGGNETAILPLL